MEVKSDQNLDCNTISGYSGIEVTDAEDGLIMGFGIKAARGLSSIFICNMFTQNCGNYFN